MVRPKKSASKQTEFEDVSQEVSDKEPVEVLETPRKGAITQSGAARAALEKGYEKPAEAVAYIKNTFGIDMNPQYFSAIKTRTKDLHEAAPPKPAPARRGQKAKAARVEGYLAPPEKPKVAGEPDVLLALEGVKELVSQFGADKLKRMIDLLG
jgi:hypothetical protein